MTLLEGEDLTVQDGQVMVRTVRGLEPLGLLWRRIDGEFADPLELNEGSQIGTPGLIGALRRGNLSLINALGSGVVEARAFMAFLPRICETLLGEPLKPYHLLALAMVLGGIWIAERLGARPSLQNK